MTNAEKVKQFVEDFRNLAHRGNLHPLTAQETLAVMLFARWLDNPASLTPMAMNVAIHENIRAMQLREDDGTQEAT